MRPAPPRLQCAIDGCKYYTIYHSGYCQQHVRVCACGKRMSLKATRCKSCWVTEQTSNLQRALRKAAHESGESTRSRTGQVKWLLRHYIRLYKSGRDQAFAEQRIRALSNQL